MLCNLKKNQSLLQGLWMGLIMSFALGMSLIMSFALGMSLIMSFALGMSLIMSFALGMSLIMSFALGMSLIMGFVFNWCMHVMAQMFLELLSKFYVDGLVQERHNSIANALELRLSYTKQRFKNISFLMGPWDPQAMIRMGLRTLGMGPIIDVFIHIYTPTALLYPPYPKDRGMLWFYVEAARRPPPATRHPPPAMVLTR